MPDDRDAPIEEVTEDILSGEALKAFGALEELINNSRTPGQAAIDIREMIASIGKNRPSITKAEWLKIESLLKKTLVVKYPYLGDPTQIHLLA